MYESVNRSGIHADAYQNPTVLSEGPSDRETVRAAITAENAAHLQGRVFPCSRPAAEAAARLSRTESGRAFLRNVVS